ncbi:MAG: flagellar brake protein [Muricomes sp.]
MARKLKNKSTVGPEPGMKISVGIQPKSSTNTTEDVLSLSSVVEEIPDDKHLLIQMPMHQGYHYFLPADQEISLYFFSKSLMYRLPVKFVETITQKNLLFAKVVRTGEIASFQRRDCYRLPCFFPVTVEYPQATGDKNTSDPQLIEAKSIDFSDSGMLFAIDENLEKGENITLTFYIGRTETIGATVIRTTKTTEEPNYKFKTAVKFSWSEDDLSQKQRFYKYIVEKQMEERRRETQG